MEKVLYFSFGNKGGCGKSFLSMLTLEYLGLRGPVLGIETDPKQYDLLKRYGEVQGEGLQIGSANLNQAGDSENAVTAFGNFLDQANVDQVVVNLPAGSGETLDGQGYLIRGLADAMGYRLVATYAMEIKDVVSLEIMKESLKSGFLSVIEPENRFVVYPLFKGEASKFAWYNDPLRKKGLMGEIAIPAFRNTTAIEKMKNTVPGRILAIRDGKLGGLSKIEQVAIARWIEGVFSEMDKIFGKDSE
ncbi:hypothetical protein ABH19_06615 [Leptospirillum sp. Group II 'CF-1']|jgi:hypothetical protein|uniref:hypothetical protein n=1 Tax=Leptospirillum sp. Group II 'CF-1' TaxID=1660083 RepID=UPI00067285E6|nr:hypothetical protein [Leptospirillum sp. Group II 'CF-1']AKS23490.1 hypothetical protein ABH19_06615 [Leptospirillum sp. Group II 'CF-1']